MVYTSSSELKEVFFMTIYLNNITAAFGEKELFSIEQLTIPTGSKVGIIGDNGSGKTTLLHLIAGKFQAEKGQVQLTETITMIDQLIDSKDSKSGGEQTKERIQQALYQDKGIILADEPTNHLDEKGIQYLENQLKNFRGTVLIVSHNREFLNRVADKILEIDAEQVKLYEGNYQAYQQQKAMEQREHQKKYEQYQKERQKLKKAAREVHNQSETTRKTPKRMGNSEARLHKMGNQRAKKNLDKQADALKTRLEQLEVVEKKKEKSTLIIPFKPVKLLHKKIILEAEEYNLTINHKVLLENASFKLKNHSRTALLGVNGSGKTTLLNQILKKDEAISFSNGIKFGYFSQSFEQLDEELSVLENALTETSHSNQVVRDLLAHMQFRKETIYKKVGILSGGERSKLAICKLLLSDNNVLLLDEPTNHLDISSIQVLETALKAYEGTILFTSHDEAFVKNIATDFWKIDNKKIISNDTRSAVKVASKVNDSDLLLLETRKTTLLSQLSFAPNDQKEKMEQELQEVLAQIKELKQ